MTAPGPIALFDSHCHLPLTGDARAVLDRAHRAGVDGVLTAGTDVASSAAGLRIAQEEGGGVVAAVGIHPHDAESEGDRGLELLDALVRSAVGDSSLVAIGECGLDYHYDHSPRERQRDVFARQARLAADVGLALVVHSREAWEDTFAILSDHAPFSGLVLHCFSGGPAEMERVLALGGFVSFSGMVTFANAAPIREAAAACPLDRVLVETDSPFLAPVPHRGRPNEPALLPAVATALAATRGMDLDDLAPVLWQNTSTVFGLED